MITLPSVDIFDDLIDSAPQSYGNDELSIGCLILPQFRGHEPSTLPLIQPERPLKWSQCLLETSLPPASPETPFATSKNASIGVPKIWRPRVLMGCADQ